MGTSLSWPGMHEGQVEVSGRAPSPPPHHSTQAKKLGQSWKCRATGNEGPLCAPNHHLHPPLAWRSVSGSSRDCREWEGVCVSQELQRMADEKRDEVEPEPGA